MKRLQLGGSLGVGDRLERLVLDAHRRRRTAGLLGLLGRDHRDRLAEVADAIDRENGLVRELEAVGLRSGHVLVGQHRMHAGHPDRLGDVDREQPVHARAGS